MIELFETNNREIDKNKFKAIPNLIKSQLHKWSEEGYQNDYVPFNLPSIYFDFNQQILELAKAYMIENSLIIEAKDILNVNKILAQYSLIMTNTIIKENTLRVIKEITDRATNFEDVISITDDILYGGQK